MIITGTVFDPSVANTPDGQSQPFNQGRANELIVAELHGKYFEQCYRGNVFYASTNTTGVVVPISSTLSPTYSIWNPAGSGKLCVPIVTLIGYIATAEVLGCFVWMATTATGDRAGATSPFTAFVNTPAISARLGGGKASQMLVNTTGTTTITAAATFFRNMGISTVLAGTTTSTPVATPWFTARDDWDGTAVIPPGNAIHLMGATALAVTVGITTVYAELPL